MNTITEDVTNLIMLIMATHDAARELELPRYSTSIPAAIGGADLARCLGDLRNAADSARAVLRALQLNWTPQSGSNVKNQTPPPMA